MGVLGGYVRNEEMAKIGHILIAFHKDKRPETNNMIKNACRYGLKVFIDQI